MTAEQASLVTVQRESGRTLISFKVNSVDEGNFVAIADELEEVSRAPHPQSVVIDMTGVRHLDELGLAVLQAVRESVRDVGGTAVYRGPTRLVENAIHATRLAREIALREANHRPSQWTQW
jgi:anti-anti-sigma factor